MAKHDLTRSEIERLDLPLQGQKQKNYTSSALKGLTLNVKWRPNMMVVSRDVASKSPSTYYTFVWRLRYAFNGLRTSIDLGYWPNLSQEEVLEPAYHVIDNARKGINPKDLKRASQELSVPESFTKYELTCASIVNDFLEWRRKNYPEKTQTNDFYASKLNLHVVKKWGLFHEKTLTPWVWQEHLREIKRDNSANLAKQVHASWRAANTFAVQSDKYPHIDANRFFALPILKDLVTKANERFFSNTELHEWMNSIHTKGTVIEYRIVMLQLYLGPRISEILNIKLSDLKNLSNSEIPIIVKGNREDATMVSSQAIELIKKQLKYLIENDIKTKFLFPNVSKGNRAYEVTEAVTFISKLREKWIPFTSHDLRRTMRTWLQEFCCSLEMRNKILNHTTPTGKDASYDHAKMKNEHLRWVQLWADKLDEIKINAEAFTMDSETAIDKDSAIELDDLIGQLI